MLDYIADNGVAFLTNAGAFIGVLTVIVFFHELGHFLVGRWCGVRVDVFSIGFGREIFGWNDKHGTRWKLAWLPLGGYVKFAGDANAASLPDPDAPAVEGTFHSKPLWQRASVIVAGPMANFILAIVIFAGLFFTVGQVMIKPLVGEVMKESAAEKAGLLSGDLILEIDGSKVVSFTDIPMIIANKYDVEIPVIVDRNGEKLTIMVTPSAAVVGNGMGRKMKIGRLGIRLPKINASIFQRKGLGESIVLGTNKTWSIITGSLSSIKGMIVGTHNADQLAGPLGIAKLSGKVAKRGWFAIFELMAILSVSIGLINLFPVPMLDGGHLLYYTIEAVRGKALSQKVQEWGFMVGMVLVLSLMIFATKNDLFMP